MTDTNAIEARIKAALERIETAALRGPADDSGAAEENEALRAALEDERLANAQLTERVKAIRDRQETTVSELEAKVERLNRTLASREDTMERLRKTNDALRANNAALRAANGQGVGDPDLINAGSEAELVALRAARTADRTEIDDVLGELEALIGKEAHHA